MNKKNMFLTVLFAISAMPVFSAEPEQSQPSPKGWSALCKSYATSLISGGLVGTATGTLSIYALAQTITSVKSPNNDVEVIFGLITSIIILIAENRLRRTLTDDIHQNLEENAIKHNKNLLYDTAWIASWISFVYLIKTTTPSQY